PSPGPPPRRDPGPSAADPRPATGPRVRRAGRCAAPAARPWTGPWSADDRSADDASAQDDLGRRGGRPALPLDRDQELRVTVLRYPAPQVDGDAALAPVERAHRHHGTLRVPQPRRVVGALGRGRQSLDLQPD